MNRRGWTKLGARCGGAWLLLAALTAVGCGPSKGNISGVVKLPSGDPLPAGQVTFFSQSGGKMVSNSDVHDGRYSISNFPSGLVKIKVETPQLQSGAATGAAAGGKPPSAAIPKGVPMMPPERIKKGPEPVLPPSVKAKGVQLNPRYNDPEQSALDFEVIAGDQEHDILLKP